MKDKTSVEDILKELTLEEKCSLLSGESFWYSQSIEEKGIEKMMFTDGPHGLRKQNDKADHLGVNKSVPATCFPPACALGASWNETSLSNLLDLFKTSTDVSQPSNDHIGKGLVIQDYSDFKNHLHRGHRYSHQNKAT